MIRRFFNLSLLFRGVARQRAFRHQQDARQQHRQTHQRRHHGGVRGLTTDRADPSIYGRRWSDGAGIVSIGKHAWAQVRGSAHDAVRSLPRHRSSPSINAARKSLVVMLVAMLCDGGKVCRH
jgi:hypothetical protein